MDAESLQQDTEKALEREQSHTAKLLEHHLKIQALERKVGYLQGELDGIEARCRERQKVLMIFTVGMLYGMAVYMIFTL